MCTSTVQYCTDLPSYTLRTSISQGERDVNAGGGSARKEAVGASPQYNGAVRFQ